MAPGRTRIGRMRSFDSKKYQARMREERENLNGSSKDKDSTNETEESGGLLPIVITPGDCTFSGKKRTSKHKMVNQCDRKLAFKVRSSDNSTYTLFGGYSVVGGFIDVAEAKEFVIKRKAGKPLHDKLTIYFCDATGPDALEHFKEEPKGEVVGETLIKLSAAE